jgi:aspartyl-tRNA(Asn)/glutamyl-tRNA(Gln) amidotransferase subunit C
MAIDKTTVRTVADLARLELAGPGGRIDEASTEALVSEFVKIVGFIDVLAEAPTQGVEPLYSPMIDPQPPRADVPVTDARKADDILGEAPERIGRYFSVPRIF